MANEISYTGKNGIELIKRFEGLSQNKCRNAVGFWTIGYGHLISPGETFDHPITEQEAEALLRRDLSPAEKSINKLVSVPLTQNQFDALASFALNVGVGRLASSTLLKRLNMGDYHGAANELLKWNKAGGQVLANLTRRRLAEQTLFNQSEAAEQSA
ncbi:lysozyme [Leminorella grimontii]|uniref:Lysozyme n=1 Tax=Leminorella grimontii TaxID=82981 RepID=A0AAV5MWD8_9GAMM|nr:lysozyme [Leminorella grimontii]KFC95452.1 phage lysozyme [Leminorella grimontii ATCC 33999 = DSM 5078]GKX53980.1 lysozyme [Leminorella grimontii]VFS60409.1 Phage-related lysozyme (muraminidase) [Leminorella grimontii]